MLISRIDANFLELIRLNLNKATATPTAKIIAVLHCACPALSKYYSPPSVLSRFVYEADALSRIFEKPRKNVVSRKKTAKGYSFAE